MSTEEETIQLRFATVGKEEIQAHKNAIRELKENVVALSEGFKAGRIAGDVYKQGLAEFTKEIREKTTAINQIKQAMSSGGGAFRDFGRAAYVASQGIEDLQYGLGGIINNIPQLVMAF